MHDTPSRRPLSHSVLEATKALLLVAVAFTCFGVLGPCGAILNYSVCCYTKHDMARLDLHHLEGAFKLYARRTGRLPPAGNLAVLVDAGVLETMAVDPWNNPYLFTVDGRQVKLWSHGADGRQGGEGQDEDVARTFEVDLPPR
ncbi:hypothetical protein HPC49_17890 [Pyxidicoccus fallax]|uniref:Type II secretion system protein GspG C-terminal domain-containing protein n=1 Tax=Pyxidicoccus fallax TaxID=394095 RepID=A0A848LBR9_9BACT|nr:type II secretion system protein GspG [Pyxidicoccus fallax]NMO16107.1 hypothetical protein [Pyxidicoccus fallax]NPC80083.1 hypothetical protein [Pyxidicoccus fallax]